MKGIQHISLSNQLTSKLTFILNLEVTKVIDFLCLELQKMTLSRIPDVLLC